MPRTPDEARVDDALTAALEEWLRVNQMDGSADDDGIPRVLTDYVIFAATQGWAANGDVVTGHPYIVRDGTMPLYRAIGLGRIGLRLIESTMDDDDEESGQ